MTCQVSGMWWSLKLPGKLHFKTLLLSFGISVPIIVVCHQSNGQCASLSSASFLDSFDPFKRILFYSEALPFLKGVPFIFFFQTDTNI